MTKAINECYLVMFQHCILYIQQFKILGNLERKKKHFPIDVNGDVAQKVSEKKMQVFKKL